MSLNCPFNQGQFAMTKHGFTICISRMLFRTSNKYQKYNTCIPIQTRQRTVLLCTSSLTDRYFRDVTLKNRKKNYQKRRIVSGLWHVRLFMIIIFPKDLSLLNNFEVAEGYHPVTPTILSRYSPMQLFPKPYKSSYMITFTSIDSVIGQCIRSLRTVMLFGYWFRDLSISNREEYIERMYRLFYFLG